MPKDKISMTLMPDVIGAVDRRGDNRSAVVSRDLDRYYYMLSRALPSLRRLLSTDEVALLCDALNGTLWHAQTMPFLPAQIADALQFGLAEKWEVDGSALVTKLAQLDLLQVFALVDAIERFWTGDYRKEDVDWAGVLA